MVTVDIVVIAVDVLISNELSMELVGVVNGVGEAPIGMQVVVPSNTKVSAGHSEPPRISQQIGNEPHSSKPVEQVTAVSRANI